MDGETVGRDEELERIGAFLDVPDESPSALVLEGDAGIGKSTLWASGVDAARERGLLVLSARPAEAERKLAGAVLGDLLEDVLPDVLPALSPPQRRALELVLLLEDPTGSRVEPRTLGVAVRSSLQSLADERPLLLAIDDDQWVDPLSAAALSFALRRLEGCRVVLLLSRRPRVGAGPWLEEGIEGDRVARVAVRPLSLGAVQALVRGRLGRTLSRQLLLRVHDVSGGNPFYALELARGLGDELDPTLPLAVPDRLEDLVLARLEALPEATRDELAVAAAVGRAPLALFGEAADALEPAFAAQIAEESAGIVQFTHPLLASVLYQGLSAGERRRAHGRAAAAATDALQRARHEALAAAAPDAEIAAALEEAAGQAHERSAPATAAELAEHSVRLTPPGNLAHAHRRTLVAARAHLAAGDGARARSLIREVLSRTPDGAGRANALVALAEHGPPVERVARLLEALPHAAADPSLEVVIHERLAVYGRLARGRHWALQHAEKAVELAGRRDDAVRSAGAATVLATLRFDFGEPGADRLAERAYEHAVAVGEADQIDASIRTLCHVLAWSGRGDPARAFLEARHREWSGRDEQVSATTLWYLALVELWAGRWQTAAEHAERARELHLQYDAELPQDSFVRALVAAHRGELERARSIAAAGLELARRQGGFFAGLEAIPGIVALWSGDAESAETFLARADEVAREGGWGEPAMHWWRADRIEALLELARVDEAVGLLDAWEADARRVGRDRVLAQVARCRGLVAAATGHVEPAIELLERAVAEHETVGDPFGRARALLALGIVRRRAKQQGAARESLTGALRGFEEVGASTWVDRAAAELGRIPGRTRIDGLTPAERRVAELVAAGRTNREVAAALFLGERTVASHLTHIYAKLGIRSRTELAAKVQTF
jgi:DNA-binding CsgD family transcriptional regulator